MVSIIIISYNVKFFLEQCLYSVRKAARGIESEVIVVDNRSADDSAGYLEPLFPEVIFIRSEENLGFGRACNLGFQRSSGNHILFLNPDTLVPEHALTACLEYFLHHPKAGALGVTMLDGKGRFLPESKRAFPSPLASLYKLSGLAAVFPSSGHFNRYGLGNREPSQSCEVEVLAGAFLFCRKAVLEETGGFDERFFLYGEDIDLSYRIKLAGWENHYFAGVQIIHFKGESAGKEHSEHIRHFHAAMLLFIEKHYRYSTGVAYRFFLQLAIITRAVLSFTGKKLKPFLLPLTDIILLFISLHFLKEAWTRYDRAGTGFHVPFIGYAIPLLSFVYVVAAALTGLYDKVYKASRGVLSMGFGIICMLAFYSLLPEPLRFSRAVVLGGGLLGSAMVTLFRASLFPLIYAWLGYELIRFPRKLIVASEKEYAEVSAIFQSNNWEDSLLYPVRPDTAASDILATAQHTRTREIVLCEGGLSVSAIIALLKMFPRAGFRFLFHMSGSRSIIGSDRPSGSGRTITDRLQYRIAQPWQQRKKRVADMLAAFFFLLIAPLHFLLHKHPLRLLGNTGAVLSGKKTWIGYHDPQPGLPSLPPCIMAHTCETIDRPAGITSDQYYALTYEWWRDICMVFAGYRRLA